MRARGTADGSRCVAVPGQPTPACAPLQGFVADATDCYDADDQVWTLLGETGNLRFSADKISPTRDLPAMLGGTSVLHNTLRSENPGDFESISCIEQADGSDTTAIDVESPPAGVTVQYLVRAENGCGLGSVATDWTAVQRSAAAVRRGASKVVAALRPASTSRTLRGF